MSKRSKMTRNAFAKYFRRLLRQHGVKEKITYDRDNFMLRCSEHKINLNNVYENYCATDSENRKACLDEYLSIFTSIPVIPDSFDRAKTHISLRLHHRYESDQLEIINSTVRAEDLTIPYRLITEDLWITLSFETDNAFIGICQDTLDCWGVTFDQAYNTALSNLMAKSSPSFIRHPSGFYHSSWLDKCDATRIVIPEMIQQLKVTGLHVITVPNRNALCVCGSDDYEALRTMVQYTLETYQKFPYAICTSPYVWDGETWRPFLPVCDHPILRQIRTLHLYNQSHGYDTQKYLLDEHHKNVGETIHVADFNAHIKVGEEDPFVISSWIAGARTLLPRTDHVGFVFQIDGIFQTGIATWDRVMEAYGHMMQPQGYYPERFLVEEFPPIDQVLEVVQDIQPTDIDPARIQAICEGEIR